MYFGVWNLLYTNEDARFACGYYKLSKNDLKHCQSKTQVQSRI